MKTQVELSNRNSLAREAGTNNLIRDLVEAITQEIITADQHLNQSFHLEGVQLLTDLLSQITSRLINTII
jgi:hypothetical protein